MTEYYSEVLFESDSITRVFHVRLASRFPVSVREVGEPEDLDASEYRCRAVLAYVLSNGPSHIIPEPLRVPENLNWIPVSKASNDYALPTTSTL